MSIFPLQLYTEVDEREKDFGSCCWVEKLPKFGIKTNYLRGRSVFKLCWHFCGYDIGNEMRLEEIAPAKPRQELFENNWVPSASKTHRIAAMLEDKTTKFDS